MPLRLRLPALLGPLLFVAAIGCAASASAGRADVPPSSPAPVDLRCEYASDPVGIDETAPRLSWRVDTDVSGAAQSAYRVLVASSPEQLAHDEGDLWDTGRIASAQSANVVYAGRPLASRERCWWKVRVWDEQDRAGEFSRPASFEVALLADSDWSAVWMEPLPSWPGRAIHYRCPFRLPAAVRQARLYITGLGYYEAYVNGARLGRAVLAPSISATSKRVYYQTFDVTSLLRQGSNTVGATVGSGWDGRHILRAQLEVTCQDGTRVVVGTGRQFGAPYWWDAAPGGIVSDSIYGGEHYNALLEKRGWARPDYDGRNVADRGEQWSGPFIADGPSGRMKAEPLEPIEVLRELPARKVTQPRPGVYVFDFGLNHAGWCRLTVRGPKGTTVTLRYAEVLAADGTVNQDNLTATAATDRYTLAGSGDETWAPRFTYHGHRYVQVEGWPGTPAPDALVSLVVRSAVRERGEFACSDETLNRIHALVRATEESNLFGMPTDCPNRNERLGWLNDLGARSEELVYNYEAVRLLEKFVRDISDTQDDAGSITDTAPFKGGHRPADPVSVSYLLIPALLQQHYGDVRVLQRHIDGLRKWVDFLTGISKAGIVRYSHWGDWAPPISEAVPGSQQEAISAKTPGELVSTAFYFHSARLLSELAQTLGDEGMHQRYAVLASDIATAFNREFWNEAAGCYGSGNQACNAIPLYLGLVPDARRERALAALLRAVEQANYHVTTGNLATKHLLEVLSAAGQGDAAVRIATQKTYPGWGYMLEKGATTLFERWEFVTTPGMHSQNHPMLGSVDSWLYRWVAGLQLGAFRGASPHFVFRPPVLAAISHARASLPTLWGTAAIEWEATGEQMHVVVRVPWNCTATVDLPKLGPREVTAGRHEYTVPL